MSEVVEDDPWADWPERWVDGPGDVRAAMKAVPRKAIDELRYDALPWARFPHFYGPGDEVPGLLATLVSDHPDAAARALSGLWTRCIIRAARPKQRLWRCRFCSGRRRRGCRVCARTC
ncbi:hypothetical protein ACPA54_28600 [Uniformispora flossi]|uniref:hypothetical protein n=1 Tax=Uniformispora flossi TaxID=3390723 RepID=UPI003C2B893C